MTKLLTRLGLDFLRTLHEKFPTSSELRCAQLQQYGPEKDSPGFDAVCWAARGGVANVFREDGESPAIAPQAFGDYNVGHMLATGIVSALFNRTRTGKGEKVVTNLYAGAIWGGNIGICATQFGAPYPKSLARSQPLQQYLIAPTHDVNPPHMPQYDKYYPMMMGLFGHEDQIENPDTNSLLWPRLLQERPGYR